MTERSDVRASGVRPRTARGTERFAVLVHAGATMRRAYQNGLFAVVRWRKPTPRLPASARTTLHAFSAPSQKSPARNSFPDNPSQIHPRAKPTSVRAHAPFRPFIERSMCRVRDRDRRLGNSGPHRSDRLADARALPDPLNLFHSPACDRGRPAMAQARSQSPGAADHVPPRTGALTSAGANLTPSADHHPRPQRPP